MNTDLTFKAIKKRYLKERGIDEENFEDYILELEAENKKIKNKKRKINNRQLLSRALKPYKFGKKQKKLIITLSSLEPRTIYELENETGSKNFKFLVRDTNRTLKRYKLNKFMVVKSCKELKLKGYYQLAISYSNSQTQ